MANADYLAGHHHQIENAMADSAPQAFHFMKVFFNSAVIFNPPES